MNRINSLLSLLAITALMSSCVSFPEPNPTQNTMVIGKIIQTGKNFPIHGSASVNGVNTDGIELTMTNLDTKTKYQLTSGYGGIFSSLSLPSGEYELNSFYLRVQSGNSAADIRMNPGNDRRFFVAAGVVNNLGSIEWNCDADQGMEYWLDKNYGDVQAYFSERYPKSGWLGVEWRTTPIGR